MNEISTKIRPALVSLEVGESMEFPIEKMFAQVDSLAKEGQCVSLIAGLLRYVKDQMVYTQCIEQLGKIHGKTRLWRSAVEQIRNNSKKSPSSTTMDRKQKKS